MDFADNASLAVQTPAVDFVILNQTVSPYQYKLCMYVFGDVIVLLGVMQ